MPMMELGLPVGATALKITVNGRDYSILLDTDSFDRAGEDGDVPIIPLCRGCEFVGEVLPGEWKKGWGADIDTFTARIDSGVLELGGLYDGSGADSDGWIDGHHPIPLMDSTVVTIELESPTNDTDDAPGSGDNIKTEFYIRQDKAVNSPDDDDNYLKISIDVTAAGLFMEVIEEIAGTPNTIFDGSTYDDTSNRDDAAEQFTIWRIVFHDAVAGATSPEDVRHIHIYLKQGVDRAGAEAATENELSTSPYAIDDYLFDVGYPAYRIYTTDTGYFGDEVGSGYEAISTYLRVDYPSLFSLKYDFADVDVGMGDVELWDGDPDVSTSVQVFDEDHFFIHDPYLQNGLIRLHVDELIQYGLKLYSYYGAAWNQPFDQIWFNAVTDNEDLTHPMIRYIEQLSPEKTAIIVRLLDSNTANDDYYIDIRITLERGKYSLELDSFNVYPDQDIRFRFLDTVMVRFGYVGDDEIGDSDPAPSTDGDNSTLTDNFLVAFDDAGEAVLGIVFTDEQPAGGNTRFFAEDGGDLFIEDVDSVDVDGTRIWVSLVPFSLVANLFKEAEDDSYPPTPGTNIINGATAVADGAASGGNAALLDAQNEEVYYAITAGTDLPEGRYLYVFRIRDINQVANDIQHSVFNQTDSEFRNEENSILLSTATAAYAYQAIVFDITAADVTGTDEIRLRVRKQQAAANEIYVDYILIIPIGDGESWSQDLSHAAMRNFNKPKRLYVR